MNSWIAHFCISDTWIPGIEKIQSYFPNLGIGSRLMEYFFRIDRHGLRDLNLQIKSICLADNMFEKLEKLSTMKK